MSDQLSTAVHGTTVFVIQAGISGILRIINLSVLTWLLLQAEMGQIAILGIVYGFLQFIGTVGLSHSAPLVVPEMEESGQYGEIRAYLKRSITFIVTTSLGLVLVLFLLFPFLSSNYGIAQGILDLMLVVVPFSSLEVFLDSFLLARYDITRLALGRILFNIVRVSTSIGLVLIGFRVAGVISGWLLGEITAVLVFGYAATRGLAKVSSAIDMRPILAFALPNLAFQAIDVTIQNADRLILQILVNLTALGVYDVFLRLLYMFSLLSLAIATSLYPLLTRARISSEHKDSERFNETVLVITRYILLFLMPIAVIVALNSRLILITLFAPGYAAYPNATIAFSILVLAYVLWGVVYGFLSVLRSLGESRFFIVSGLTVIGFELTASWYLTAQLGLLGSAVARALYITLLAIIAIHQLRHREIRKFRSLSGTLLRASFASTISGLLLFVVSPSNILTVILWFLVSFFLYLILLLLIGEARSIDFQIARALLPSRWEGMLDKLESRLLGETDLSH